jgi:glycosyltransferase involved in cell wall biosynthesis
MHEYRDLLARAPVVVIPIRQDNAGITSALMAMALGRPVVIGRSRFVDAYLIEGKTCLTYTPGNSGELAALVNRLLENPREAASLGRSARRFVEAELGPDKLFKILYS